MTKTISILSLVALITALSWLGINYLFKKNSFPIKRIVMVNKLYEQDNNELQTMISKSIDGGFFSLDIEKLRQKIETLAWVDTVSVRKKWPSTLQLDIKEKQVAARWITSDNEKRTINIFKCITDNLSPSFIKNSFTSLYIPFPSTNIGTMYDIS